jgi:hypothetical protein
VSIAKPHEWVAWPAGERRGRTLVLIVIIAALAALAWAIGGDWLWGVTALALLGFGLNRWFLPSTFSVGAECLEIGYPLVRRTLRWPDVRRLALNDDGGWISTRSGASRLDARHGLDLYWGKAARANSDAVLNAVQATLKAGAPISISDRREDVE